MARDRISEVLVFLAVARERGFSKAAAKLGLSPSSLSHTVRRLEESLGERLLTFRPQLAAERGDDGMLNIDAIAEAYWFLHHQQRSAWTLELDLRPWAENF